MNEKELRLDYLPDDSTGLEDKDTLIKVLRRKASNLGDGRCLCSSCLAAWTLAHFIDHPDKKWTVKPGSIAKVKK